MRILQMSQVDNLLPEHIKSTLSEAEIDSEGEINMERVPFAKNTNRLDLKQIDKSVKVINAQNKENVLRVHETADENQNRAVTPANEVEVQGQPLTPTANLKVLFNAMSPELRHRDEQKKDTSDEDNSPSNSQQESPHYQQFETIIEIQSSQEIESTYDPSTYGTSRKEKSLGLLCQKFLQKYPEYPKSNEKIEICLDEVAKELQVERRRIYDIVNVLESVEIVSRVAKNKYAWHGKSNLHTTLAKLKALGDSEGFGEQIQKLKDFEFNRELEEQIGRYDPNAKPSEPDFSIFGESSLFNQAALRKDKSLGIMSQKFLMLFLVSKPKTVNLDLSAKLLIGDANIDKTESSKFKTKIRRLYDIANILTSLELIRKVHVTEIRGRKPAFKYVGPDIDNTDEVHSLACCSDGCHRPSSRHSMLDCIQNQSVARIMNEYKTIKPGAKSETGEKEDDKLKFGRHSSFEQLCAVAAVETTRMKASSEPPSPTKMVQTKQLYTAEDIKKKLEAQKKEAGGKKFVNLTDSVSSQIRIFESEDKASGNNKLPTKGFVRKKYSAKSSDATSATVSTSTVSASKPGKIRPGAETIIIKTSAKQPGNHKQPTVIPLTKEQIDAVLRSLKVPVPVVKESVMDVTKSNVSPVNEKMSEDVTQIKASDLKEVNEKTPVVTVNTPVTNKRPLPPNETIPAEKRIKLDFPSPSSEDERSPYSGNQDTALLRFKRKMSDTSKPSPQRALHLAPEFVNPDLKQNMAPSGDAPRTGESDSNKSKKIEIIINESTSGQSLLKTVNIATSGIQLANQPTTVLHLPIVNIHGQQPKVGQPMTLPVPLPHNVHIIQDRNRPVQHVVQLPNLPVTFSPPLTPNSSAASSPSGVFSYSYPATSSNITLTNVQIVQPSLAKGANTVTTLIRPIATKAIGSPNPGSQIVPPQLVTSSVLTPTTYLNKTPGGFVPISNSLPKITVRTNSAPSEVITTKKLTDISALS